MEIEDEDDDGDADAEMLDDSVAVPPAQSDSEDGEEDSD